MTNEQRIAARINAMEIRIKLIRAELKRPPEDKGVYYLIYLADEIRLTGLMIGALRNLLDSIA